mmetsp:Transcript_24670/g.24243  ORF Transcript_24670/g.24243 Transcript_24670/m.24243 type:complete len:153 (-) Transcript_24670:186-644(-)
MRILLCLEIILAVSRFICRDYLLGAQEASLCLALFLGMRYRNFAVIALYNLLIFACFFQASFNLAATLLQKDGLTKIKESEDLLLQLSWLLTFTSILFYMIVLYYGFALYIIYKINAIMSNTYDSIINLVRNLLVHDEYLAQIQKIKDFLEE